MLKIQFWISLSIHKQTNSYEYLDIERIFRHESWFVFHPNDNAVLFGQAADTFEVKGSFVGIDVKMTGRFIFCIIQVINQMSIVTYVMICSLWLIQYVLVFIDLIIFPISTIFSIVTHGLLND